MTVYAPGTQEKDQTKQNMALQEHARQISLMQAGWATYTPVVTAQTGSITSYTATGRYLQTGKTVILETDVVITSVGTAAGLMVVTLPINSAANRYPGVSFDYGATLKSGACHVNGPSDNTTFVTASAAGTTFFTANLKVVTGVVYETA